jgi:hypothetical protein
MAAMGKDRAVVAKSAAVRRRENLGIGRSLLSGSGRDLVARPFWDQFSQLQRIRHLSKTAYNIVYNL